MKLDVYTLRYGNIDWLNICAPTLDAWCDKHGYQLHIYGKSDNKLYPCDKFQVVDMLRHFVASDATHMMYVDADVYIHPSAPKLPDLKEGLHIRKDVHADKWSDKSWKGWCWKQYKDEVKEFKYKNAGIWSIDKQSAKIILTFIRPPYKLAIQEQHQFNYWIHLASKKGLTIHELDSNWNHYWNEYKAAYFYHFVEVDKMPRILEYIKRKLIPTMKQKVNIIACIHNDLHHGDIWKKYGNQIIVVDNPSCKHEYPFTDRVITWSKETGHHDANLVEKFLFCVDLATKLNGPTAIVDGDCFITDELEVTDEVIYGSRLWDAMTLPNPVPNGVCRYFVHPPYVASQYTWNAIYKTLLRISKVRGLDGTPLDGGFCDMLLGTAAAMCQIRLEGIGFSRNTVTKVDLPELNKALKDGVPLIHGIKDKSLIEDRLVSNKIKSKVSLWHKYKIGKSEEWFIDETHVNLLHEIIMIAKPKVAMEIGSYKGASLVAFLEAMDTIPFQLHVVEPVITPELAILISTSPHRSRIIIHKENSYLTKINPDFIFIDGDHDMGVWKDMLYCFVRGVPTIAMHDTRTTLPQCKGSREVAELLRGENFLEDCKRRPDERTERGFGLWSEDIEKYKHLFV